MVGRLRACSPRHWLSSIHVVGELTFGFGASQKTCLYLDDLNRGIVERSRRRPLQCPSSPFLPSAQLLPIASRSVLVIGGGGQAQYLVRPLFLLGPLHFGPAAFSRNSPALSFRLNLGLPFSERTFSKRREKTSTVVVRLSEKDQSKEGHTARKRKDGVCE